MNGPIYKRAGVLPYVGLAGLSVLGGTLPLLHHKDIRTGLKSDILSLKSIHQRDIEAPLPRDAVRLADRVAKALQRRGIDLTTARIGVTAVPAAGKTALVRALTERTGLSSKPVYGDKKVTAWDVFRGRGIEGVRIQPGSIAEKASLLADVPATEFDAVVQLRPPQKEVLKRALKRGRTAWLYRVLDLPFSQRLEDLSFESTVGGKGQRVGDVRFALVNKRHAAVEGRQLDDKLRWMGIQPKGLTRHQKFISLASGKRFDDAWWKGHSRQHWLSPGDKAIMAAGIAAPWAAWGGWKLMARLLSKGRVG